MGLFRFATTDEVNVYGRKLTLTDYFLPQTVEAKSWQAYEPLPPADPVIARSLETHDVYSRLVNVDHELPVKEATQIPYFWHIHKSGGKNGKLH